MTQQTQFSVQEEEKERVSCNVYNGPAETGETNIIKQGGEMLFPCAEQIQLLNIIN